MALVEVDFDFGFVLGHEHVLRVLVEFFVEFVDFAEVEQDGDVDLEGDQFEVQFDDVHCTGFVELLGRLDPLFRA